MVEYQLKHPVGIAGPNLGDPWPQTFHLTVF